MELYKAKHNDKIIPISFIYLSCNGYYFVDIGKAADAGVNFEKRIFSGDSGKEGVFDIVDRLIPIKAGEAHLIGINFLNLKTKQE